MTEQPTGPDVFEAAARLRAELDRFEREGGTIVIGPRAVGVSADDLAAVLDARRDHALSDGATSRAIRAWNTDWPRHGVPLNPRSRNAMRAAITAALQLDPKEHP